MPASRQRSLVKPFEPSSSAAALVGPKARMPAASSVVDQPGDERRFRSDDDEVDPLGLAEGDDGGVVAGVERDACRRCRRCRHFPARRRAWSEAARRKAPRRAHARARPTRSEEPASPAARSHGRSPITRARADKPRLDGRPARASRRHDRPLARPSRRAAEELARPLRAGLAEALSAGLRAGTGRSAGGCFCGRAGGRRRSRRSPASAARRTSGTSSSSSSARSPCAAPGAPTTT